LGNLVVEGRDVLDSAWWISVFPGLAIRLVVPSFNLFGDWLRDVLAPRLRQL
jgi:peptide/nickel transport system permease protein